MIPSAAKFIVGDDDHHVFPLRTRLQLGDQIGDVRIAVRDRGIARVLVELSLRLIKNHRRQAARGDLVD